MIEQNNTDQNLAYLWRSKNINYQEYFFRQKANKLKIKTYQEFKAPKK
jgi:hypothetical protein|tara:strand:+ start:5055 stop:5198 length:144 start_codon:yes stop_codon:yes gene_type:complete